MCFDLPLVVVVVPIFLLFRQARWLEETGFPAHAPTMPAVDLHGRDRFALLARAFVELGAKEHLPTLPAAGARDVASALAATSALVQAGVPAEVLVNLAAWYRDRAGSGSPTDGPGSRVGYQLNTGRPGSLGRGYGESTGGGRPVGRRDGVSGRRPAARSGAGASRPTGGPTCAKRGPTGLQALGSRGGAGGTPARGPGGHRRERAGALVAKTLPVPGSRLGRSLPLAHFAGGRCSVAASLRRGGYRSAQNYFDAAVAYQERFREQAVDPLLKKAMRRYTRAVLRALPGSRLKAVFSVDRLAALLTVCDTPAARAWSPWTSAHAADALLLAAWFMLREIEFAAARTQDLDATGGTVTLRVPLAARRN